VGEGEITRVFAGERRKGGGVDEEVVCLIGTIRDGVDLDKTGREKGGQGCFQKGARFVVIQTVIDPLPRSSDC